MGTTQTVMTRSHKSWTHISEEVPVVKLDLCGVLISVAVNGWGGFCQSSLRAQVPFGHVRRWPPNH
jgi:hypothetical protein